MGVVVIPNNFLPDGRARIVALNQSNDEAYRWVADIKWGDTSLPNLESVPTTDNLGSSTNGSSIYGCLPSDLFVEIYNDGPDICATDPSAVYYWGNNDYYTPSPYRQTESGLILNTDYISSNISYNVFADFDGKSNTDVLVALGSDYEAACHARNYTDGHSNLEYYLPSMGELGVMMTRLETINNSIESVGGSAVPTDIYLWSSSEYDGYYAWHLCTRDGRVGYYDTDLYGAVRSFAKL